MSLQRVFDGWLNELVAEEDFVVPANLSPVLEELDEEEDLAFGESQTPAIDWRPVANWPEEERLPGQHEEMAWSGVTLALGSLCEIIGGTKQSYQENHYDDAKRSIKQRRYCFKFIPGETGFQTGRL